MKNLLFLLILLAVGVMAETREHVMNVEHASNRIVNYRRIQNWENFFLASAICSVAKSLDAEVDDFHFYAAFTGDMFAYLYSENPNEPANCDSGMTNYFFDPESVKRAYAAFGYECVYWSNADIKKNCQAAMNAIKTSVDKGIPVVAWGMGNVTSRNGTRYDPLPEGCLIGGYDGDVLLVNLYLGSERLPEGSVDEYGYSRITNGLETTGGLFIAGEKLTSPDMRQVCETAIETIPVVLRHPPENGYLGGRYVFGKTAFEVWAKTLEMDSFFDDKTDEELSGVWWNLHGSPYCCVCTSNARDFVNALAQRYPDWTRVTMLAPLYEKMNACKDEIWALQGGFCPPMNQFRTHAFRVQIADILRKMGGICDEIVSVFEQENAMNMEPRMITEPDVLIVEMPPCRMMTSGPLENHDAQERFDAAWMRLGSRIADKINPRDFMYHDKERDKMVWLFMLEDWMTEADTEGYEIIMFDGGLFAAVLADSWEYSEWERMDKGLNAWLSRQEHLERDEGRQVMFHFAGPHSKQMKEWKYGKVRYFVPLKIIETKE